MAPQDRCQLSKELTNKKQAIEAAAGGRAVHSNWGGGGPAKRIKAFDEATKCSKQKKASNAMKIPQSEPLNPMAPKKAKKRPGRRSRTKDAAGTDPNLLESAPPTYLVPPGTEPNLQANTTSRFGFQPQVDGTRRPDFQAPHPTNAKSCPQPRETSMPRLRLQSQVVVHPLPSATQSQFNDGREPQMRNSSLQVDYRQRKQGNMDNVDSSLHSNDTIGETGRVEHESGSEDEEGEDNQEEDLSETDPGVEPRQGCSSQHGATHIQDWELSPDTENRCALEALHEPARTSTSFQGITDSTGEDILKAYQESPTIIRNAGTSEKPTVEESDEDLDSDSNTAQSQRAGRFSKTLRSEIEPKPTQFGFYPANWHDVLELAKRNFHLHIATENGFPTRNSKILQEPSECVAEALAEHQHQGGSVESGYWKSHKKDMAVHVYEDQSTYRSEGKKIVRKVVRGLFKISPSDYQTPREYKDAVAKLVNDLIADSNFLHEGKDGNGRTNNFANSALKEITILLFYTGNHALASHFPATFVDQVPQKAIALAAALYKCCLDELKMGTHTNRPFSYANYCDTYLSILKLMEQVELDPYHRVKFSKMQKDWVEEGMTWANVDEDNVQDHLGFKVHLN